jgi:sugar phosphate isomerase/epimerase
MSTVNFKPVVLDTWFYHSLGSYSFEAKCEMVADLGFEGIYFTLWSDDSWADVPRFGSVKSQFGIDADGVYASINGPDDAAGIAAVARLLEEVEGVKRLELAILGSPDAKDNSDPSGDAAVIAVLGPLLEIAQRRDITISLYPHTFCWLQTTQDAVRLAAQLQHPNLKLVFSGHHWYVADGKNPAPTIRDAMPYLNSVNLCGSRRVASDNGMPATVELLDEGELDNFYLASLLHENGYSGSVGIQGYSIGGDVYPKLRRSLAALRDIESRVQTRASWAALRNDPLPSATGAE